MSRWIAPLLAASALLAGPALAQSGRSQGGGAQAEWCRNVQRDVEARVHWLNQERVMMAQEARIIASLGVDPNAAPSTEERTPEQIAAQNNLAGQQRAMVSAYNARVATMSEQANVIRRSAELYREHCAGQAAAPAPAAAPSRRRRAPAAEED